MVRVRETDVRRAILGEVRNELKERSPLDGYRPYDAARLSPDLKTAFEQAAQGKGEDESISINAVVDAYASQLKQKVDQVNTSGPAWLTGAEAEKIKDPEVRERVIAVRTELSRGSSQLSEDALLRKAARFVADHSAPVGDSSNAIDVFFPSYDSGNGADWDNGQPGIDGRMIQNKADAELIMKILASDAGPEGKKRLQTFDPDKELLIIVRGSDDETHWYPAAIDKKTGKSRGFDTDHNEVDFTWVETAEDFEKVWGPGSAEAVEDEDYSYAFTQRLEALMDGTRSLPLEATQPPGLDKERLTNAAAKALQAYFAGIDQLPSLDLPASYKATLEAIHAAVKDGQAITVGEKWGDPILMMPRKFAAEAQPDYMVGWAISDLITQVPSLRRFYNVNATAAGGEG